MYIYHFVFLGSLQGGMVIDKELIGKNLLFSCRWLCLKELHTLSALAPWMVELLTIHIGLFSFPSFFTLFIQPLLFNLSLGTQSLVQNRWSKTCLPHTSDHIRKNYDFPAQAPGVVTQLNKLVFYYLSLSHYFLFLFFCHFLFSLFFIYHNKGCPHLVGPQLHPKLSHKDNSLKTEMCVPGCWVVNGV